MPTTGDGHYRSGPCRLAHLQILREASAPQLADEVGEEQGEEQQAADAVDAAPRRRKRSSPAVRQSREPELQWCAGKADGTHADHIDEGEISSARI